MAEINATEVTIDRIGNLLETLKDAGHSFMLHGSPGCGKSQVIKEWCHKNGYKLIIRMLSQMQPSDFVIPHVDKDRNVVRTALTDWLAEIPKDQTTVIFLDELPAAPHDVQVAA
ncbi:MAG: AAA family ATPase [Halobacteria archaeon]